MKKRQKPLNLIDPHITSKRESNVMIKILYNVKNTTFQTTLIIKGMSHREQPAEYCQCVTCDSTTPPQGKEEKLKRQKKQERSFNRTVYLLFQCNWCTFAQTWIQFHSVPLWKQKIIIYIYEKATIIKHILVTAKWMHSMAWDGKQDSIASVHIK